MSHCSTLSPHGNGHIAHPPTPHWRVVPSPRVFTVQHFSFYVADYPPQPPKLNFQTARLISTADSDFSLNASTERVAYVGQAKVLRKTGSGVSPVAKRRQSPRRDFDRLASDHRRQQENRV
jgi:hypothetical protein